MIAKQSSEPKGIFLSLKTSVWESGPFCAVSLQNSSHSEVHRFLIGKEGNPECIQL